MIKPGITILVLLFFPFSTLLAEPMTMEVIPLKYRLVNDVIPVLQPLVSPGGTVTGMNDQLIIKTTPSNLTELKQVLQSLDHKPRKLMILVKQDTAGTLQSGKHGLSGRYADDTVHIETHSGIHDKEGVVIGAKDDNGNNIRYHASQKHTDYDDTNSFRVQAVEGYPAFIHTGQLIPVQNQVAILRPDSVVINEYSEYHDATSGFYVLPRLNGSMVTLFIAPRLTNVGPGRHPVFDTQSIETTATGLLGEWIRIGGVDQTFNQDNQRIHSSSSSTESRTNTVLIRVDEIK